MLAHWQKSLFSLPVAGRRLKLSIPHSLFSTNRLDEGTLLLLAHLPPLAEGSRLLDMGCGYGALGLALAAISPSSSVLMVDRDLLAVEQAAENAAANGLANASAAPSLGFAAIAPSERFALILCNIPARIGPSFTVHLVEGAMERLAPGGELRLVAILDLLPELERLTAEQGWQMLEVARGRRHAILSFRASAERRATTSNSGDDDTLLALYGRDALSFAGLSLLRPRDYGGDDKERMARALPLLLDSLPRSAPASLLAFRCGYGALPLALRARYPGSSITTFERDLLGAAFARLNERRLSLEGAPVKYREGARVEALFTPGDRFDLAVGELSPSFGEQVAEQELSALRGALAPGGAAHLVLLEKLERRWLGPIAARQRLRSIRLMARDGYTIVRITPS